MKNITGLLAGVGLALASGCASTQCPPENAAMEAQAHHHAESASTSATSDAAARALAIPAEDAAGPERQVTVLLDKPTVKAVSIRLRKGVELTEHTAPNPAIIQAVSGSGVVKADGQEIAIDTEHFVQLAPNVPHSVVPKAGTDMVLLVMHLRGGPKQ